VFPFDDDTIYPSLLLACDSFVVYARLTFLIDKSVNETFLAPTAVIIPLFPMDDEDPIVTPFKAVILTKLIF
jgi:hypothetical protein